MIRRPPRSTLSSSSAASDVYKRQGINAEYGSRPSQTMRVLCVFLVACVSRSAAASCPANMSAYRTSHVATSFEPSMLDGFWYEHAYIDLAQVGSSCQTLNGTHSDSTGVILMDFAVKYGPIPFTIVEQYTPKNASTTRGLYTKQAKMPGGKFLTLSTVMLRGTAACCTGGRAGVCNQEPRGGRSHTGADEGHRAWGWRGLGRQALKECGSLQV
eukprot:TRINITY_DN10726_c0_g1_i6.p1 TRINITY_DN10726_c0_g1~~TRINITY_DN10726_c0_g1_i6.p1  ORF type:complete len:214 (-),score=26.98 TRINITY_DN10726_c0_g1_i6:263-904(-)